VSDRFYSAIQRSKREAEPKTTLRVSPIERFMKLLRTLKVKSCIIRHLHIVASTVVKAGSLLAGKIPILATSSHAIMNEIKGIVHSIDPKLAIPL